MSFDVGKFAQSMQKLGQTMLQGTILIAANDARRHGGMYGPSIWGKKCGCGMGMYYSGGMPSPFLSHSMYSSNTTNPALIQQGMMDANAYGAQIFQNIKQQLMAQKQQSQTPETQTPDTTQAKEFENNLTTNGEHTFVTEKWTETNNKNPEEVSEDEQLELAQGYFNGVSGLAISYLFDADNEHGNNKNDSKLSEDEFSDFAKAKFGANATNEKIKLAFERLDVNKDNNISTDEMTAAFTVLDEINGKDRDGKISKNDYEQFIKALADNNNTDIEAKIKKEYDNYGFGIDEATE